VKTRALCTLILQRVPDHRDGPSCIVQTLGRDPSKHVTVGMAPSADCASITHLHKVLPIWVSSVPFKPRKNMKGALIEQHARSSQ